MLIQFIIGQYTPFAFIVSSSSFPLLDDFTKNHSKITLNLSSKMNNYLMIFLGINPENHSEIIK